MSIPPTPLALELAVQSAQGARVALAVGADRIELCTALRLGGLTPSPGAVEACLERAREAGRASFVHVLVRPRPGGFVFDRDEVDVMVRDIRTFNALGVAGVVVGALTPARELDTAVLRRLIDAAEDVAVTVHRAVDVLEDPASSIERLRALGVGRVLTSGGASVSGDGIPTLARMVAEAAGRVQIMAGGGVTPDSIPALAAIGVDAVHLSAKRVAVGAPSGPGGGNDDVEVTDEAIARRAAAVVRGLR